MSTKKILLVDDDNRFLEMMKVNLELNGFNVITSESVLNAVTRCENEQPDVIISDINMPENDGFSFRRKLLEGVYDKFTPFLFLTGNSDENLMYKGFRLEADDYIVKTTSPRIVVEKVKSLLKLREQGAAKNIQQIDKAVALVSHDLAPKYPMNLKTIEFNSISLPYNKTASGDILDSITLPDGRIVAVLGDVSGKCWNSWFLSFSYTGYIRNTIRKIAQGCVSPAQLLEELNCLVYSDEQLSKHFFSLAVLIIDDKSEYVAYSATSSYPVIHVSRHAEPQLYLADGPILGVQKEAEFNDSIIRLLPGDEILLYSDGLIESKSPSFENFGIDRILTVINHAPADAQLVDSLLDAVNQFSAGNLSDDLTILQIKRRG